jgi:hypothetical protein
LAFQTTTTTEILAPETLGKPGGGAVDDRLGIFEGTFIFFSMLFRCATEAAAPEPQ